MEVSFESRAPDAALQRELVVDRLQFKMRRLEWLIPRAKVQLIDINGPRGGIDKLIQIEMNTQVAGTLIVKSVSHDWRSALEKATARAVRLVLKALKKTQNKAISKTSPQIRRIML